MLSNDKSHSRLSGGEDIKTHNLVSLGIWGMENEKGRSREGGRGGGMGVGKDRTAQNWPAKLALSY